MSTPKEHLTFQSAEIARLERELEQLRGWGVPETESGFQRLLGGLGTAIGKVGRVLSRTTTLVRTITGLSPGEIRLWADAELGWMTEARARPGAPPVYKYVSDEVAEKIVKREITPELEEQLLTPDPYLGE
ncbi:hypothetical protein ES708_21060 [subsurface metagenome]